MASSDIAFTPAVKAIQARLGSRAPYERTEEKGGWATTVTPDLAAFLGAARSIYLATANARGQPYIQHRGGPPGFLRPLDEHTLGFADFAGNRQYISLGNLAENPRAYIFIMDYAHRQRVKLWGVARVVEDDPDLVGKLMPAGYAAKPERAILFRIAAWDANCRQHIPVLLPAEPVAQAVEAFQARIAELEAEVTRLREEQRASV